MSTVRKHQVFVSSTFVDLREAREAVTWELLKGGFIPVGMENFSAVDNRGWKTIERAISLTDYYVLIVGGLYGSIDDDTGISWTEREYDYAVSLKVPVLAFIRNLANVPGDKVETGEKKEKLEKFLAKVQAAHLREQWSSVDDLRSRVPLALMKHVQEDEAEGTARPGWYRGPASVAALEEIAVLSAENRELRTRAAASGGNQRVLEQLRRIEAEAGSVIQVRGTFLTGAPFGGQFSIDSIKEEENALNLNRVGAGGRMTIPLDKLEVPFKAPQGWQMNFRPFQ